jgi:hypothetical protein
LRKIVICTRLTIEGVSASISRISAKGIILVSTRPYASKRSQSDPDRFFHRQLLHAIDQAVSERATHYDEVAGFVKDPEWEGLNGEGLGYSQMWSKEEDILEAEAIKPGIWTYYSLRSPSEDKAVLFSYMMHNYSQIAACSKRDRQLELKINLLKRRLSKFDKHFDETFWQEREHNSCDGGT